MSSGPESEVAARSFSSLLSFALIGISAASSRVSALGISLAEGFRVASMRAAKC